MRLATVMLAGEPAPRAAEVRGGRVVPFTSGTVLDRLASEDRTPAPGDGVPLAEATFLEPILRPRAIFAVGLNYAAHVAETRSRPPATPMIFLKLPSSSTGPSGPVRRPAVVSQLDYEAELAFVMGPGGTIAGYTVADDISARDLQAAEGQWTRAKGADTFCPWGPWITTADEAGDVGALTVRSWVNGELRQDGNTSDLVFGPERIVEHLQQTCTLEAGDLVLTGTPAGVGMGMDPPRYLEPGDVVRVEVERLGTLEHRVM